jgi:hypothetical protein
MATRRPWIWTHRWLALHASGDGRSPRARESRPRSGCSATRSDAAIPFVPLRKRAEIDGINSVEGLARDGVSLIVSNDDDDLLFRLGAPISDVTKAVAYGHLDLDACKNSGIEAFANVGQNGYIAANERPVHPAERPVVEIVRGRLVPDHLEPGPRRWGYALDDAGVGKAVGLSELLWIGPADPRSILALERSYERGRGNSIRLYRASLDETPFPAPIPKRLIADLAGLPGFGTSKNQPRNAGLDNYEGMTWGPCLDDGSRSLVLVSDDNNDDLRHPNLQVSRILVLSL